MKTCRRCGVTKDTTDFYTGRATCKDCKKSDSRKYYAENTEVCKAVRSEYYLQNSDIFKDRVNAARAADPERHRAYARKGMAKRVLTGAARAECAKRRTRMSNVKPSSIEALMIKYKYEDAARLSQETGIPHHVDHIWPIARGGPHLPWNMQILTASENQSKGAKL
jgi:5-methylcytosine-specific restriction endonuclease McrA